METTTQSASSQKQQPGKKSRATLWIMIVVGVILLAVIGYLGWLVWSLSGQNATLTKEKTDALVNVSNLGKQLNDAKAAQSSSTNNAKCTCTPVAASQSLKDNIHDAISSKNTAALQGYMASSVTVVIAASEKGGAESPTQAVTDLDYLSSATSPWNFSLSTSTLASYKAHFYSKYFSDTAYVGKAASGQVVSFDFDCNGKIDQIFMAASEDLLTQ